MTQMLNNIDVVDISKLSTLGNILLRFGLITDNQLNKALKYQKNNPNYKLGEILIMMNLLDQSYLDISLRFQKNVRNKNNVEDVLDFVDNVTKFMKELMIEHKEVQNTALNISLARH